MEVLVFKTNVTEQYEVSKVQSLLAPLADIKQVSFDLEDCDHVLRIVCDNQCPREIESLLESLGLFCCELEDGM